jgi:hypothetical protein
MLLLHKFPNDPLTLTNAIRRNEHIIVSRDNESQQDRKKNKVCEDEPGNHERVIPQRVEFGVREAEDDAEHGRANVAEEDGPEGGNLPVLLAADYVVEVTADLVALFYLLVLGNERG